jgi:flagellar biosynthesis GTPase FlhF
MRQFLTLSIHQVARAKYEFTIANDYKYSRKANGLVLVHFRCPFCRAKLNEYANHIGTDDECPACEKAIVIGGNAEDLDNALKCFSKKEREEQKAAERVAAQKVRRKQKKQVAKEEKRKQITEAQEKAKQQERERGAVWPKARQEELRAQQKAKYELKTKEFQKQTGWEGFGVHCLELTL